MLGEKAGPRVVDQHGIGLKRVVDGLAGGVAGLQRDDGAEVVDAEQRRLAALPG